MKLVPFNLEEALANPERVYTREGKKVIQWCYADKVDDGKAMFPLVAWVGNGHTYVYDKEGRCGGYCDDDRDLMLKAKKKTIPFDETLLGKEGVRVIHKGSSVEVFFKYKSDKISCQPFVFELFCDVSDEWLLLTTDLECLKTYYVMEVEE